MGDFIEAIFTADSSGTQSTCSAWDPRTGTNVMVYKGGGGTNRNSLALIRHEYLITANNSKPMLHIWPLNSQDQVPGARLITPGKVSALDVSPDGNYLAAGIQESIHIWHLCSGKMLTVLSKHYQIITKIRFTDDGSHFISAGQDGNILVWNLTKAVSMRPNEVKPLYTFSDHGLSVTDFHVGTGGIRSLLYSVSLDRTCRVYDLSTGGQLLNIIFPDALRCIVANKLETMVFVGTTEGLIYEINLVSPPRSREYSINSEDSKNTFTGHKGNITCLSLSIDGELLMSGGADENVNIWHIPSRQLLRSLPHKAPVSNAIFTCVTSKLKEPLDSKKQRTSIVTNNLKRMIEAEDEEYAVETIVTEAIELNSSRENPSTTESQQSSIVPAENADEVEKLKAKINELQKVNKELFNYCTKNILTRQ